jgi:hypothetical protein
MTMVNHKLVRRLAQISEPFLKFEEECAPYVLA